MEFIMLYIILRWSQAHIPGINAEVVTGEMAAADPIIAVAPSNVGEIRAIFAAFCASIQQGDIQGCALLRPLFAKHGIVPAVSL
jgi:hypothetical protein